MKASFTCENPGDTIFTLTVSLSLRTWIELRDRVPETWPGWELRDAIGDMIAQATEKFYPKSEDGR